MLFNFFNCFVSKSTSSHQSLKNISALEESSENNNLLIHNSIALEKFDHHINKFL